MMGPYVHNICTTWNDHHSKITYQLKQRFESKYRILDDVQFVEVHIRRDKSNDKIYINKQAHSTPIKTQIVTAHFKTSVIVGIIFLD